MEHEKQKEEIGDIGPEKTEESARQEIARLIHEGNTSGILDYQDGDKQMRTAWRVVFNTWE